MVHIGVVVEDLPAATAFFLALGLELEGETTVQGDWVDRIVGLEGVRSEIVILRTADGGCALELTRFQSPPAAETEPGSLPANAPGIRHILFQVQSIEDTLDRLQPHGATLVGEVVQHRESYRLCYLRGPAGIIVELAEPLG
jgi:catechol 2,3-dioxygenase-like lactoylglutathione lyase family enzyme